MDFSSEYTLQEIVHQSPEAILYRAQQLSRRHQVLLKVLRGGRTASSSLGRLHHEYELGRMLELPSIARPLALGSWQDKPALVLEGEGVTLAGLLKKPLSLERFLTLAIHLTSALAELHSHQVIHKDLKPENVLIHPDTGQVRLCGLGIATLLPNERRPAPQLIEGSLAYMSPEQTGRMNRALDSRTDLYSLGVLFYQMLTGSQPFQADDPVEWIHSHIARQPPPPHERAPGIPPALSALVLKLLAKSADERYQSALGLQRDLEHCLQQLRTTGTVAPFPLARHDVPDRFLVPQQLHGREEALGILLSVFEQVARSGTPELVLVSGAPGIGKSSMVHELQRPVVRERGLFLAGKFDQHQHNVPYATLVQAFGERVRQLLAESEQQVQAWRERLQQALGQHGQLLVELIPQLELIIGSQPLLQELPPAEAQYRLHSVFQSFLGAITGEGQPLVLFLDDLHWADTATLQLVRSLLCHPDTRHVLFVGAFRDNEVPSTHPLWRMVKEAREAGASVRELTLGPLSPAYLGKLVAGALHRPEREAEPLARLVHERTAGNPFFAIQFLTRLHQEGLISFDVAKACWCWDMARIRAARYTDNVVDLLLERLERLPEATREVLRLAACLGNSVDAATLATVCSHTPEQVHHDLWQAVREGLLLRTEDTYTFLHDRVQQAAWLLIPEERRAEVHLNIGRRLLAATPPSQREARVFDIVQQLNVGAALLSSPAEREELAELNLLAGHKAKASAAWASAAGYLAAGMAVLGPESRHARRALDFSLRHERAWCEYLSGQRLEAERLLQGLLAEPWLDLTQRADVSYLQVEMDMTRGELSRAIAHGLECLKLFGYHVPEHPSDEEVARAHEELLRELGGRTLEELLELPLLERADIRALMRVLVACIAPAMFMDRRLMRLLATTMSILGLRHGHGDASGWGYACLGLSLVDIEVARYQDGYRFGVLAYELVKKHRLAWAARVSAFFTGVRSWVRPERTNLEFFHEAIRRGLEEGDLAWTCYTVNALISSHLYIGTPLEEVWQECERNKGLLRRADDPNAQVILEGQRRFILCMQGRTASLSTFSDEHFREQDFEASLKQGKAGFAVHVYFLLKLQARLLAGEVAQALEAAHDAQSLLWSSPYTLRLVEYHYFAGLALAAACGQSSAEERSRQREQVAIHVRQLQVWAENCPENFAGRHALLAAELARLRQEPWEAMRLYEEARRRAGANGYVQDEALAYELAARFFLEHGFEPFGQANLREARSCYARWGAKGKVAWLDRHYPHLVENRPLSPNTTFTACPEALDLLTVLKASQTISSDLHLPRLLETLLRAVLEHMGAERGCLLVERGEALEVQAEAHAEGGQVQVRQGRGAPVELRLPASIAYYVSHTRESVVLEDATAAGGHFGTDPYLLRSHPRSVLCMPLVNQGRLQGLLYLENSLAPGAFTPDRFAGLRLLAAQVSISLENARLYRAAQQAVQVRDEFLSVASHELKSPLASLSLQVQRLARLLQRGSRETPPPEVVSGVLEALNRQTQRLARLGGQLLDVSLLHSGRLELMLEPVDLGALVREVVERTGEMPGLAGYPVEVHAPEHAVGHWDRSRLEQVLLNLLTNAMKYGEGRPVRVRVEQDDGLVRLEVQDEGIGISSEDQGRIFERFERVTPTRHHYEGLGLGLYLTRQIVLAHGGSIRVRSAPGQGSTFTVELPREPKAEGARPRAVGR